MDKKIIAVLFGGTSLEHDVSVITGLQIAHALDSTRYDVLPVYISRDNRWFCGDYLLERKHFPINEQDIARLDEVFLPVPQKNTAEPSFITHKKFSLMPTKHIRFDLVFPALHGDNGENGAIQGLFEVAGIPFVGSGVFGSAVCMDKRATKLIAKALHLPVLDAVSFSKALVTRPEHIKTLAGNAPLPCCVKANSLGSSIGVYRCATAVEVEIAIRKTLELCDSGIIEPFVDNLVEYNVAVSSAFSAEPELSVIERPVTDADILDFNSKYASDGESQASKFDINISEGLLNTSRQFNPDELTTDQRQTITDTAKKIFSALKLGGSVRIDFLANAQSGELWLNEVNTIPGSLAYYLWENSAKPVGFTAMLDHIIDEGLARHRDKTSTGHASDSYSLF